MTFTSRLVAFSLPGVRDTDIVITADVDAFITSNKVMEPLKKVSNTKQLFNEVCWKFRLKITV